VVLAMRMLWYIVLLICGPTTLFQHTPEAWMVGEWFGARELIHHIPVAGKVDELSGRPLSAQF
jgi:hypothetical protein